VACIGGFDLIFNQARTTLRLKPLISLSNSGIINEANAIDIMTVKRVCKS
jgi:hypothetical protein